MKNKKHKGGIIAISILLVIFVCSLIYGHFGGFSTGKSADVTEFAKYAKIIVISMAAMEPWKDAMIFVAKAHPT